MKRLAINIAILLMASAMGGALAGCEEETTVDYDYAYNVADLAVGKSSVSFGKKGGTQTFNVQSTQAVTAVSEASWLRVEVGAQSPTLKSTPITLTVDENISGQVRTATLTVTAGGQSQQLSVTQSADLVIDQVSPTVVSGEGGTITVTLRSESPYDVVIPSDVQGWLSLGTMTDITDVTPGTLQAATFTLVAASHLGEQRQAQVTVRSTSTDGYTPIEEVIYITQEARKSNIDTEATAMSIAAQMHPGWNLGNTFEGTSGSVGLGDETGWQSTVTSQAVIDFVKAQGFRSVRIPCSWHRHMDASGTIDAAWINRVKEVVDYCIKDDLYVLLNDHYDEGWLETHMDSYDATRSEILKSMWTQVATAFQSYDEHLLFAGLNEPNADNQAKTDNLVRYEQDFIDAVRATGGNNAWRTLVVQGPSTDIDNTNKFYNTMPTDVVEGRLMLEVHYYSPWTFCGLEEDASWGKMAYFWGAENHVSGSDRNTPSNNEEDYVRTQMQKMKTQFFDRGIPVILGEYGCQWREIGDNQDKHDASVKLFHKTVVSEAISAGIVPMVWCINYCNHNGTRGMMTILDRANLSVWNTFAMQGITEGTAAASWPQ